MSVYLIAVKFSYLKRLYILGYVLDACTGVLRLAELDPALLFKYAERSVLVCSIIGQNNCCTIGNFIGGRILLGICTDRLNVYTADIYNTYEILPWLRTFIGRITDLQCTDEKLLKRFREDFDDLAALYRGGSDDLP